MMNAPPPHKVYTSSADILPWLLSRWYVEKKVSFSLVMEGINDVDRGALRDSAVGHLPTGRVARVGEWSLSTPDGSGFMTQSIAPCGWTFAAFDSLPSC